MSGDPGAMTVGRAQAQSGLVPVDSRVLLAHVLGVDRAWLAAHAGDAIAREQADSFFALAKRRREGEPVAYLTGRREFWGLDLAVSPAVLIPRPETETLVEAALARLPAGRPLRVLDLGTGSGAIALAIARERPHAQVVATDVSADALEVAKQNAARLAIANVAFGLADVYDGLGAAVQDPEGGAGRFDLVASNPPYVAERDPHLAEGDLRFEPRGALAAGPRGLDVVERVVAGAPARLVPGGWLLVEHGHDQAEAVQSLLASAGFGERALLRDLAGIPRVAAGRLPA